MADKETALKNRFWADLEVARKYTDPIHQKMDENYEKYRNRWREDLDFRVSDLYAYVETITPILTNNRVRGFVKADFPEYLKHAEGMGHIVDNTFDVNNWDYISPKIVRTAEIYRSAIAYTGYDPDANNKTGKLIINRINPRWCYYDPAADELNESSFFFFAQPMRESKVIKMYPDKADQIKARGKKDSYLGTSNNDGRGIRQWFRSWLRNITNALFVVDGSSMNRYSEGEIIPELTEEEKRKNAVAFIHYWYRDDDDKWRVSYWADDVFLEDVPNPFWHERLPYALYSPVEDILSALGVPISEQMDHLNEEKNVLLNMIVEAAKKAADPPMLYNTSYGNITDPQKLREQARDTGMIPVNNPDMVPLNAIAEYMHNPPMPNFTAQLPEQFDMISDRITGVNDSFRGTSQATSGKEVQLKQEAAYTRIKTKVDSFEKFVKELSEMMIVNAMQFIKSTTPFRVKGDYQKYQDMINTDNTPFQVKPIPTGMNQIQQQDGTVAQEPTFDRNEFFLYANPNEWTKVEQDPTAEGTVDHGAEPDAKSAEKVQEAYRILQLVVEIEAGSSLPVSRSARREDAFALFKAGAIDQDALLEEYDWPKRDEIAKRMQEAQQQQQQAEMQAQQSQMQAQQEADMTKMQADQQHQQQMAQMQATNKQPQQPQGPDVAGQLDWLRQQDPRLAKMSDEQLLQFIAQMSQQQAG